MHADWLKSALEIQPQMDAKIVTGAELDTLIPGAGSKFKAALYQASDGTAEPTYSVSKIAMGAIREGVKIVAPCAARSVEREGGKVAGVHTEKGYIKAKYVVMAGGAWSSLFAGNIGVRVPQLMLASSMQRLSRVDGALPGAGYGPDFTWRMQADGETSVGVGTSAAPITKDSFRFLFDFLPTLEHSGNLVKVRVSKDFFESLRMKSSWGNDEVTPFEQVRMLSGEVDRHENDTALANLRRAFPQYEKAVDTEEWAGMIDATPDSTQFVTDIPDFPGALPDHRLLRQRPDHRASLRPDDRRDDRRREDHLRPVDLSLQPLYRWFGIRLPILSWRACRELRERPSDARHASDDFSGREACRKRR